MHKYSKQPRDWSTLPITISEPHLTSGALISRIGSRWANLQRCQGEQLLVRGVSKYLHDKFKSNPMPGGRNLTGFIASSRRFPHRHFGVSILGKTLLSHLINQFVYTHGRRCCQGLRKFTAVVFKRCCYAWCGQQCGMASRRPMDCIRTVWFDV